MHGSCMVDDNRLTVYLQEMTGAYQCPGAAFLSQTQLAGPVRLARREHSSF